MLLRTRFHRKGAVTHLRRLRSAMHAGSLWHDLPRHDETGDSACTVCKTLSRLSLSCLDGYRCAPARGCRGRPRRRLACVRVGFGHRAIGFPRITWPLDPIQVSFSAATRDSNDGEHGAHEHPKFSAAQRRATTTKAPVRAPRPTRQRQGSRLQPRC